jgi:hypothetical protein
MTSRQHAYRRLRIVIMAAVRGATCHAVRVLRALQEEQVRILELSWSSSQMPVDQGGPLAWIPGLDGPRLTGCYLPISDDAETG